jgi:membrane protease YdiL (CAAX protease family)
MVAKIFLASDRRLRTGWRFVLSVGVTLAALFVGRLCASWVPRRRFVLFYAVSASMSVVVLLLGYGALLSWLDRVPSRPWTAMGLGFQRPWLRQWLVGLGMGTVLVSAAVLAIQVLGTLSFRITLTRGAVGATALVLAALAVGALMEEVVFRGYPFQRLVEGMGAWPGTLLASVAFGLVHLENPHVSWWGIAGAVLAGILLSVAYLRARSLWLPWGIHFGWNAAMGLAFGLPVSGIRPPSTIVYGTAGGPPWLTGGAFGIEASASAPVAILAGLIFVSRAFPSPRRAPLDSAAGGETWSQSAVE